MGHWTTLIFDRRDSGVGFFEMPKWVMGMDPMGGWASVINKVGNGLGNHKYQWSV